mmetsp:Transcript_26518/g.68440  ORF Transcript_26518/g.68440 Transcript_26518/m.68440 type:complete len:281 (+) Transcript_26518:249-1091(+)
MQLGFNDDAAHHAHGLRGVHTDRRLAREHHSVRAVEDSVGNVTHLRTGGHLVLNHALEHLRRGDDELIRRVRLLDQHLLEEGHALEAEFDAEVTASNHETIRTVEDLVNVAKCGGLLDFGDDAGALVRRHALRVHQIDQLLHILALLHEAERHVVKVLSEQEGRIVNVLCSERRAIDLQVRYVDALPRLEPAANLHLALELVAGDALRDAQLHRAVVKLHAHAHAKTVDHRLLLLGAREHYPPGFAHLIVTAHQRKRHSAASLERHGLSGDSGATELGAL